MKNRKKSIFAGLSAMALSAGAMLGTCSVYAEEEEGVTVAGQLIADADNNFGSRLTAKLLEEGENVVISPYSIASVLSMLSNASEDNAQVVQLREFLGADVEGYAALSGKERLAGEKNCLEMLATEPEETEDEAEGVIIVDDEWPKELVEIANALYLNNQLPLAADFETFKAELEDAYRAEIESKQLSSYECMEEINQWVSDNTHGLISKVLNEPLSDDAMAVLMNAVYFKCTWYNTFEEAATYDQTFYGAAGETTIPMMHQKEDFLYAENEKYQMIRLPYCGEYNMYIYLPKDKDGWKEWTDAEAIDEMLNSFDSAYFNSVILSLPKFELEYSAKLVDILKELGLTEIFSEAVYEKLSEEKLFISEILHKTFIKVEEQGTEAAAVTIAVAETAMAIAEEEPIVMTIDHPFFFTITERNTGIHLFEGAILDLE